MNSAIVYFGIVVVGLYFCEFLHLYKRVQLTLIFTVLFIIFGGSHYNGADWINYTNVYEKLNEISWLEMLRSPPFEILFSIIAKLYSTSNFDYQIFISTIALFNLLLLMLISKNIHVTNTPFLFVMIFLIEGWSLFQEQIRQSIAVVLCLFSAYEYFRLNKKISYALLLVAIGFHNSAILGVMYLYIANRVQKNAKGPLLNRDFVNIFCSIIFFLILIIAIANIDIFKSIFPPVLQQKIEFYISDETSSSSLLNFGLFIYPIGFAILGARRDYVVACRNYWLSFAWSVAIIWCVVGPFLRVIAIFTRFEHFFLILLPFALVTYGKEGGAGLVTRNKIIYFIFSLTFAVRLLIQPAQNVWVNNYQNIFASIFLDVEIEDVDLRKDKVCEVLFDSGNDFCGIDK